MTLATHRSLRVLGAAALLALGTLAFSEPAAAQPRTANSLQLGGGFRYGQDLEDGDFNPWGLGLGLSLGYTTSNALYFGGVFDYFFGSSVDLGAGSELSGNVWQLGGEGGYDIQLIDAVLIRPKLGVGIASLNSEVCGVGCIDDSSTYFAAAPGATLMLFFGNVTLMGDLRYQMVFADPDTLNGLIFSFGIGF